MHEELSLSPISLWQNNLDHTYTLLTEITRTPPPCRRTDRHSLTRTREPDTQLVVRNLKQRAVRTLQTGGQLQIRTEYPWFQTASYIQRDKIDFNFWAPLASKTPCIIDTLRYYQSPLPMNTKKVICMYPTVGPNIPRNVHSIREQNVLFPREDAQAFSTHGEWCRQSIVLPDRSARRTLSLSLQPSCISCMHYAYTKLNQPWTRCVRTASTRDHRSLTDSLNWVSITKESLPQTYWRTLWKYYTSKKKG